MSIRCIDQTGATTSALVPSVGIFWAIKEGGRGGVTLFSDRSELADAEIYGDCFTHPEGHYDLWERLNRLPARDFSARKIPHAIRTQEYEVFPRGRIVYEVPSKTYNLYMDARLAKEEFIAALKDWFCLTSEIAVVRFDAHYRTV